MSILSSTITTTGSKYVPPHLRNSQGGGSSAPPSNDGPPRGSHRDNNDRGGRGGGGSYNSDRRSNTSSNNSNSGGFNDNRGGSYDNNRGGGRGGGGSYRGPAPTQAPPSNNGAPATNSRWSNTGGGGDVRAGGGGNFGRRDGNSNVNERGFHGDMRPDKRMERSLFEREGQQTTGINFDNYDKIPVESSGNDIPDPIDAYSVDTIGEDLYRNTQLCGYTKPTPVQKYSVPIGIAGRDLMACAQTGSGKTAGFLFPIIMAMIRNGAQQQPENARRRVYPEALILAPTRELASQIQDEATKFTYCTGIASVVVYGGADVREQLRELDRGCDLLVATPGRLVDLIERGRLAMDNVRFLVLDEADRMVRIRLKLCFSRPF
jgi:ATP-dependent RNA helicase DDX3X